MANEMGIEGNEIAEELTKEGILSAQDVCSHVFISFTHGNGTSFVRRTGNLNMPSSKE